MNADLPEQKKCEDLRAVKLFSPPEDTGDFIQLPLVDGRRLLRMVANFGRSLGSRYDPTSERLAGRVEMGKRKNDCRIFMASPGDLIEERRAFKEVIDVVNGDFGDGCETDFEALGWEDTLFPAHARAQDRINKDIERCDIFFLVLNRRWGQEPTGSKYTSYTEEEFELARALHRQAGRPIVYVLLNKVPVEFLADPGEQLQKVLAFRRKLHDAGIVGREFADVFEFRRLLNWHIRGTISSGELKSLPPPPVKQLISQNELDEIKKELEKTRREVNRLKKAVESGAAAKRGKARTTRNGRKRAFAANKAAARLKAVLSDSKSLKLAEIAAKDALKGKVEAAREGFAKATATTSNRRVLYLAFEFYNRTGDLDAAEEVLRRWLALCDPSADVDAASRAGALCNLGVIARTRGDLDSAEKLQNEAREINRKLGRLHGQAANLGNLGLIAQTRGDLVAAEKLQGEALEIGRKIGGLDIQANALGSLGIIAELQGNLDAAENLQREALEINRRINRLEGQADALCNLGHIAEIRGDLESAEKLQREALQINLKLRRPEGQAASLGALGLIARTRGELDAAEKLEREALEIGRKLASLEVQATSLGNLGVIAKARGNFDLAEKLERQALEIDRSLGRLEGQANNLGNLGVIALNRADYDAAEKLLLEALDIDRKLGRLEGQSGALSNLGVVAQKRGQTDAAENFHREALEIERKLGRRMGQAVSLGNLGLVAQARRDFDAAEQLFREALEIDRNLGRLEGQANAIGNLGSIAAQRGRIDEARRLWTESRDLFTRAGMPHMAKWMQSFLDRLPPG